MILAFSKKYAVPQWKIYLFGTFALGLSNLIMLEIPQLAKSIVNQLSSATTKELPLLAQTALLIVGLGFLQIGIRSLSRVFIFWPGRKLESSVKQDLFDKLISLPQRFFDEHGMGDLISRVTNDTGHLRVFFAFGLLQVLNMTYIAIFTISKMASIHLYLTFACLVPLLFTLVFTRYFMPKLHQFATMTQEAIGRLTNQVTEAYVNIHTIKANAAQEPFLKKLAKINDEVYLANIKLIGIRTIIFPLIGSLASLSQLVVLFYGGYLTIHHALSIGDILAFNIYINLMSFPLMAVGITLATYQRAQVALQRISIIENEPPEKAATTTNEISATSNGSRSTDSDLVIKNLHFSFSKPNSSQTNQVLHDISVELPFGKKLGIFGSIGSGKSTLLNLIAALYSPPPGAIYFGGRDVNTWEPEELRRKILFVTQKPQLFSDTIYNNLIFGLSSPPNKEKCIEAVKQADIYKDIIDFPKTWDCEIGEQGIKLSGGQKQRLALARAFIRSPELLLLDDVLSAVDQQTEQNTLNEIYKIGCSLIITSHRSSSLINCDEIIIMEKGRIVRRGTYASLIPYFEEIEHSPKDQQVMTPLASENGRRMLE